MRKSHLTKPIIMTLISVAIVALMVVSSGVALADDTTSTGTETVETTVPVNGTINATTISVTHPMSVDYSIDPNNDTNIFTAPDIVITNNTKVPVKVTLKSLTSTSSGTLQFTDVAPDAKEWNKLNSADSKTFIALGVKINNAEGWNAGYNTNTRYAVDTESTLFGSLNTGATGNLSLTANCGVAFDQNYTAAHSLVLVFDLA